jgi:hypothetical protein
MYTGPNTVNDGLVFGYDTGYGVADNETSTRFYPGEPTENLIHDMGGAVTSAYPEVVYRCTANETNVADTSAPGGKYSRFTGIDGSDNNQLYSRFNSYSKYVRGDSVNYSVYLKGSGTCHLTIYDNNNGYGISPTITLTDEWVRYNYTRTVSASATTYWVAVRGLINTTDVYIAGQQATRGTHSTPYIENNRSSTQSLIDLKILKDIDVSNVSFDSTGQPTFDGTDDHITGVLPMDGLGAAHTIEMIFSSNVNQNGLGGRRDPFSIGNSSVHQYSALDVNPGNMNWYFYGRDTTFTNSPLMVANKFYHIVLSYAGGASNNTNKKVWLNGVQQTLSAGSSETPLLPNNPSFSVGRDRGRNTAYWPGEIPVWKVYQTAFTQGQALQNFNAYKNRFNI